MTLLMRFKNAVSVFLGESQIKSTVLKKKDIVFKDEEFSEEQQQMLNSVSIEFLFSEFGENRVNGGGNNLNNSDRLNPTLDSLRKYFPNAKYTVYSDFDLNIDGVDLIKVKSPVINPEHPRYGYRTADYYKFKSLLNSDTDFKCVIDSDMRVVSSDIIALIYLTQRFGFCVPDNDRQLLREDMLISKDVQIIKDESYGLGHSYNQSPMTLWKNDERGSNFYEACCEIMQNDPSRGSLVMWKAAWKTGSYPYILPKQWCVCTENEGIGNEVILHVGHQSVDNFYKNS